MSPHPSLRPHLDLGADADHASMFIIVGSNLLCVLMCPPGSLCILMCLYVSLCVLMCPYVSSFALICPYVSLCVLMCPYLHQSLRPIFASV